MAMTSLFSLSKPESKTLLIAAAATAVAVSAVYVHTSRQRKQQPFDPLFSPAPDSLNGLTILITGASTGLGLETAKRLALGGPKRIILTVRSNGKGIDAVKQVQDYILEHKDGGKELAKKVHLSYKLLDLDDLKSVVKAVESWDDIDQLDVLVNNAGVMAVQQRELTVDGFERQIQSNHLGHFVMTAKLLPKLSSKARIVNVSSRGHRIAYRGLDFDYMWTAPKDYAPFKSYGQSKLANVYFTQELQRRADATPGYDWTVVAVSPGPVNTDLTRNMVGEADFEKIKKGESASWWQSFKVQTFRYFLRTVEQGATTQIWAATSAAEKEKVGGQFLHDCHVTPLSKVATDAEAAVRLWKESEEKSGVTFNLKPR